MRVLFKLIKLAIKTVLFLTGVLPLFRCSSGYRERDGKITFNGREITDKSFIILNKAFAKNSTTVYYKDRAFEYADVASFEALDEHYAKDKDRAYYCDEYREGQNYYLTKKQTIVTIQKAVPASFTTIGNDYAKDSKRGYYKGIGFDVQDVASFTILEGRFMKDKYQIYFEQAKVKDADVSSFHLLNNSYAKDTARVYYYGYQNETYNGIHEIPCQPATFTLLEYPYSKDNEGAFFAYAKINGADANSFTVVGNSFSKDKNHVYLETKILKDADAASFTLVAPTEDSLDEYNFSKDKSHVFWKGKTIPGADVNSFRVLRLDYSTDGRHIYYHTSIVKNADPATFKAYEHGYGDTDAEDATNKYLEGVKVKIDAGSIQ